MLPAEERRMKEVVLLYNKIQDKIMFLGMNAILKMNVVLYTGGFMDPNKGKKYYYGEVKYTGGEASIIKINNWGTIEKTTIARHRKAYAMTYIGKRPSDIQLSLFVVGVNGATVVTVK